MGMYTSLNVKIELKDEFVSIIQNAIDTYEETDNNPWLNTGYDFLNDFAKITKYNKSIPFGMLIGNEPDSWGKVRNQIDGNIWTTAFSTKHDEDIDVLIKNVLPKISKKIITLDKCSDFNGWTVKHLV